MAVFKYHVNIIILSVKGQLLYGQRQLGMPSYL